MPEQVLTEAASAGAATQGGAVLVADTDHTLAAENHERDKLTVSVETADAWLALGAGPAVVGQGVRVEADGPPYEITDWKGAVHIISHGAAVVGVEETSFAAGADEGEQPAGADTFVPSGPSDSFSQDATSQDTTGETYPPQPGS